MTNRIKDFVEQQEVLDNIKTSLKSLYQEDPAMDDEDYINVLTENILTYMKYMSKIYDNILNEEGMEEAANKLGITKHTLAGDVIEVLLFSTIARQNMVIEDLRSRL